MLGDGEYRLDFIRTVAEVGRKKKSLAKRGKPSLAGILAGPTFKKR